MNTKPQVKLIKKEKAQVPEVQGEPEFIVDPNRWSSAVREWVSEFQQNQRSESLPAFDSLFKNPLS